MSLPALLFFVCLAILTSFLAGIFGMAGGMILMGGLLYIVPVGDAMILHGITQLTSNGWRAILWRRYIRWSIAARYGIGLVAAGALFSSLRIMPHASLVFLLLGLLPFVGRVLPTSWAPPVNKPWGGALRLREHYVPASLRRVGAAAGHLLHPFAARPPRHRGNQGDLSGHDSPVQAFVFQPGRRHGNDRSDHSRGAGTCHFRRDHRNDPEPRSPRSADGRQLSSLHVVAPVRDRWPLPLQSRCGGCRLVKDFSPVDPALWAEHNLLEGGGATPAPYPLRSGMNAADFGEARRSAKSVVLFALPQ
ncbi:sulfite exporter TauE/SafE family protein [Jiella sp. M17.18]|uniref:sulfite exporter TauE/SafE family protein n=1 Tax=Jiella sp. M17.18 TaxID=3234247 RepID=UPI0034E02B51